MADFTNYKNKEMLWNILQNDALSTMEEKYLFHIRNEFDKSIQYINTNSNSMNLLDKNKEFLHFFVQKINALKSAINNHENNHENNKLMNNNYVEQSSTMLTSEEISNQKQEELNEKYKNMKENFDSLNSPSIPATPNFSDDISETPISNLTSLVDNTIEERNKDILKKNVSFNNVVTTNDTELLNKILDNQIKIMEKLNIS